MSGSLIEKHLGSLPPVLSRRLCETAGSANDQLTPAERLLLLGRLDLAGLALARPSALTDAQLDQLRGRPPPAVLARLVRAATGLGSVAAVVAAHGADPGRGLGRAAMEVVAGGWWTHETFLVYGGAEEGEEEEAALVAAERVAEARRPEEAEFEAEVAFRFCGMEAGDGEGEGEGEGEAALRMEEAEMAEGERRARRAAHLAGRAREAEALRAALREQLERALREAPEEDLLAVREVRARMAVEVAEEEREERERQRRDEEGMARGMRMLEVEED